MAGGGTIRLTRDVDRTDVASMHRYRELHERSRDGKIHWFDGENTPQNIATYGFLLGGVFGAGLFYTLTCVDAKQFGFFIASLAVFHFLEYLATALFNPHKLSLDSFLINHSSQYHLAHAVGLLEFLVEYWLFPTSWNSFGWINWIGLFLILVGQTCRTTAMFSARHNFSHHIVDAKEHDHVLVTHGIYSIMRHPSYFGFYWWAVGVQLLLLNPICLGLSIFWLYRFFSDRIRYEEYTLLRFFGDEWNAYKAKTPTYLPLIP